MFFLYMIFLYDTHYYTYFKCSMHYYSDLYLQQVHATKKDRKYGRS